MSLGVWGATRQELEAMRLDQIDYDLAVEKERQKRQNMKAWGSVPADTEVQPDFERVGSKKKR